MSFTHYSAKDRDDLRPISKTDAIVYPEALRKFVAEKLEPLPDVRVPDVVCPLCAQPVELRFGRHTQQFMGTHWYYQDCPLSSRSWFKLGTDRAAAVTALRGLLVAENL